jgi:hypothetical protein
MTGSARFRREAALVPPENYIRADSRHGTESAHDPSPCSPGSGLGFFQERDSTMPISAPAGRCASRVCASAKTGGRYAKLSALPGRRMWQGRRINPRSTLHAKSVPAGRRGRPMRQSRRAKNRASGLRSRNRGWEGTARRLKSLNDRRVVRTWTSRARFLSPAAPE